MVCAYSRTVSDVDRMGSNLDIIGFGCFTGIVSAALTRHPHNSSFLISVGVKTPPKKNTHTHKTLQKSLCLSLRRPLT